VRANPARGKSDDEKQADRAKYRPGDNVLPKLRRREERDEEEDEDEQRILADVQALSLREVGIPSGRSSSNNNHHHHNNNNATLEPPREHRRRERSRDGSRDSRRSRDGRRSRSRHSPGISSASAVLPPRAIEHQSSLRSLLSSSELDSEDVDEDLVRQVLEELVAEGVDLSQIGPAQEEEITERIAEAVRRRQSERHAEKQRERRERRERLAREGLTSTSSTSLPQAMRSPLAREAEAARRRVYGRSESGSSTPQTATGPPVSRPGLIDAANRGSGRAQHERSSSQGSSRSARRLQRPPALSVSSARQSSNQIERPLTSDSAAAPRRRQSDQGQPSGVESRQQFRNSLQTAMSHNPSSPQGLGFNMPTSDSPTSSVAIVGTSSTPAMTPFQPPGSRRTTDPAGTRNRASSNHGTPPMLSAPTFPRSTTDPAANEPRSRRTSGATSVAPTLYTEPQISCKHCGKEHLEHDLHYHCSKCDDGTYDLCHRCYRAGKGCKHWYGFGWTAWARYERDRPEGGYPSGHEQPHILTGHRYRIPMSPLTESLTPPHVLMSEDDPKHRLEEGAFCDSCKAFSNACYWKCDFCNEGDWGFCNDCVNQGKHCTHPLLPVAHEAKTSNTKNRASITSAPSTPPQNTGLAPPESDINAATPPRTPKSASFTRSPDYATIANLVFRPLSFTTLCNICSNSIPPVNTRYHCLKCNAGDYDICMACYHKLNVSGRISKEDGINGWRKCLRGHRMVVTGFEDRDGGQRRVTMRDLIGGYTLKEDSDVAPVAKSPTTGVPMREWKWRDYNGNVQNYRAPSTATIPAQKFPPDGGVGLRLQAKWNYWPEEGVKDELAFPRHAEIREATNINGDWYWGVYCGTTGLLPASFVAAL
jgi:Zn finger protein HypA/HybF involved in hydrogenase expression